MTQVSKDMSALKEATKNKKKRKTGDDDDGDNTSSERQQSKKKKKSSKKEDDDDKPRKSQNKTKSKEPGLSLEEKCISPDCKLAVWPTKLQRLYQHPEILNVYYTRTAHKAGNGCVLLTCVNSDNVQLPYVISYNGLLSSAEASTMYGLLSKNPYLKKVETTTAKAKTRKFARRPMYISTDGENRELYSKVCKVVPDSDNQIKLLAKRILDTTTIPEDAQSTLYEIIRLDGKGKEDKSTGISEKPNLFEEQDVNTGMTILNLGHTRYVVFKVNPLKKRKGEKKSSEETGVTERRVEILKVALTSGSMLVLSPEACKDISITVPASLAGLSECNEKSSVVIIGRKVYFPRDKGSDEDEDDSNKSSKKKRGRKSSSAASDDDEGNSASEDDEEAASSPKKQKKKKGKSSAASAASSEMDQDE
jgi:hypothetical protein